MICSNDVKCPPGIASYISNFTFSQNDGDPWNPAAMNERDSSVQQHQHISLPNCAKFTLVSTGRKEGTRIDGGGNNDDKKCPKVQKTPSPTAGAGLSRKTSSLAMPPMVATSRPEPEQVKTNNGSRHTPRPFLFLAYLLGLILLLPGTHADAVYDRRSDPNQRARLRIRDVGDKVRIFAQDFSTDLAKHVSTQGQGGEVFAHNLVADVVSSVCDAYFSGRDPGSFTPTIVEDCIKSIYGGEIAPKGANQFYAVFGASLLCDYAISEAYPVAQEFFPDGCEGLQDLARKITPKATVASSDVRTAMPSTGNSLGLVSLATGSTDVLRSDTTAAVSSPDANSPSFAPTVGSLTTVFPLVGSPTVPTLISEGLSAVATRSLAPEASDQALNPSLEPSALKLDNTNLPNSIPVPASGSPVAQSTPPVVPSNSPNPATPSVNAASPAASVPSNAPTVPGEVPSSIASPVLESLPVTSNVVGQSLEPSVQIPSATRSSTNVEPTSGGLAIVSALETALPSDLLPSSTETDEASVARNLPSNSAFIPPSLISASNIASGIPQVKFDSSVSPERPVLATISTEGGSVSGDTVSSAIIPTPTESPSSPIRLVSTETPLQDTPSSNVDDTRTARSSLASPIMTPTLPSLGVFTSMQSLPDPTLPTPTLQESSLAESTPIAVDSSTSAIETLSSVMDSSVSLSSVTPPSVSLPSLPPTTSDSITPSSSVTPLLVPDSSTIPPSVNTPPILESSTQSSDIMSLSRSNEVTPTPITPSALDPPLASNPTTPPPVVTPPPATSSTSPPSIEPPISSNSTTPPPTNPTCDRSSELPDFCPSNGCVDLMTNNIHCGSCDSPCAHQCYKGLCRCPDRSLPDDSDSCNSTISTPPTCPDDTDFMTNNTHCGGCNQPCTHQCYKGQCLCPITLLPPYDNGTCAGKPPTCPSGSSLDPQAQQCCPNGSTWNATQNQCIVSEPQQNPCQSCCDAFTASGRSTQGDMQGSDCVCADGKRLEDIMQCILQPGQKTPCPVGGAWNADLMACICDEGRVLRQGRCQWPLESGSLTSSGDLMPSSTVLPETTQSLVSASLLQESSTTTPVNPPEQTPIAEAIHSSTTLPEPTAARSSTSLPPQSSTTTPENPPGEISSSLTTTCPTNLTLCRERCVDIKTDPYHCGACYASCDGVCSDGACLARESVGTEETMTPTTPTTTPTPTLTTEVVQGVAMATGFAGFVWKGLGGV